MPGSRYDLFRRFRQTTRWLDRATSAICPFYHQSAFEKFANLRVFNLGNFRQRGRRASRPTTGKRSLPESSSTSLCIPLLVIAMRVLEGVPKSRASAFEQILHFPLEPTFAPITVGLRNAIPTFTEIPSFSADRMSCSRISAAPFCFRHEVVPFGLRSLDDHCSGSR